MRCTGSSGGPTARSASRARTAPAPWPPPGTSTRTAPTGGPSARASRRPRSPSHTWSGSAAASPASHPAAYRSCPSGVSRKTGLAVKSARTPRTWGIPPPPEQRARAAPVDFFGALQQGVVAVDDLGVDLLGHRDERHLAVQLDQREAGRARGLHEGGGQPGEARAELDDEGGDAPVRQAPHEGALLGGAGAEAEAGGEQQLAALEQRGDVGHLTRVHPAHGALEPVRARDDLGQAAAQPRQLQRPLHGDPALRVHGDPASPRTRPGPAPDATACAGRYRRSCPGPAPCGVRHAGRRPAGRVAVSRRTRPRRSAAAPCRSAERG